MKLTDRQLADFDRDGFLIVRDLFTRGELQPVMHEIMRKVDALAKRLKDAGKLRDTFAGAEFSKRLAMIDRAVPGASVWLHTQGILEPELARLWSSPKLLDIVEQFIGPDIAGHPVWNIRAKTPLNPLATVPWHQDTAYLAEGSELTFQPTAWIPFIDANSLNGTLQVIRGGHRTGKVFQHVPERESGDSRSWYLQIPETDLPNGERVTCEVPFGSVLFINQLIPHRSTENLSENIRWSVDLRWQRPGEPTGFDQIAPPVVMRRAGQPGQGVDWGQYLYVNRAEKIGGGFENQNLDGFTKSLAGPWIDRWVKKGLASTAS